MKRVIFFVFIIIAFSCTSNQPLFESRTPAATTQLFYDELSEFGDWVHNREFGYVWIPHTGRNFYPYASNGRWVYTDYGWTWLSEYHWGWAVFHYGRWDYDPQYGWFWFPGNKWAPAWVDWRRGEGYIGWAPMRPYSDFATRISFPYEISRWIFVHEHDFGRQKIGRFFLSKRKNDEIIALTSIVDEYNLTGPDPIEIEALTGKRIRKILLSDSNTQTKKPVNNQMEIYRPAIISSDDVKRPAPSKIIDIKDIKPMRERDRNYQPSFEATSATVQAMGQGSREANPEQLQNQRQREAKRNYRQKQADLRRRNAKMTGIYR